MRHRRGNWLKNLAVRRAVHVVAAASAMAAMEDVLVAIGAGPVVFGVGDVEDTAPIGGPAPAAVFARGGRCFRSTDHFLPIDYRAQECPNKHFCLADNNGTKVETMDDLSR